MIGREHEVSRQVSLALHDPEALAELESTGRCEVELPEELFDEDHPGHYLRRLKSVGLTIAGVAGPYTTIDCTLTALSSKIRIRGDSDPHYREQPPDPRFRYHSVAVESVATGTGHTDPGRVELDFGDERYLPFEGVGAISRWRIALPEDANAFGFDTISDVILELDYTARDGGEALREAALTSRRSRGRR